MSKIRSTVGRVRRLYSSLMKRYPDGFSLDISSQVNVGEHATPLLMSGTRRVTCDHAPLDEWSKQTHGGMASIFVRANNDFVRVATNITNASGQRAVGVVMDRSHPAYGLNRKGQAFYGYASVAGHKYIVDYQPILDSDGQTIGSLAVGFNISNVRMLTLAEKFGIGTAGSVAVVLVARDLISAAISSADPTGRAQLLASLGISVFLGLVAYAAVERFASRSLREAAEAARRLARGDLSTQTSVRRGDEIGGILDAQNGINVGLSTLIGRVRESTGGLTAVADEIATGNVDLSSRTEAQAGSLEQTAAAMDELTSTVRNNAENAREAQASAQSTVRTAVDGAKLMDRAVLNMAGIREASHRMSDIVGTIEGIAFQTNILALNAAVEAARAGAEGRGFAVVAQEVRTLAQRSANAAREIKELIGEAVGKIDAGGQLVDQAGQNMSRVVDSIHNVAGLMAEISSASDEQSTGIEEVNRAVGHMDEMTQRNAALVEEAAAAATSMRQQTSVLEDAVKAFKLATA
ncbi:methyl-accepting chemotaxis protein [Burkholderia sp. Bp9142]|uniref:methyl-accepting chemotaxis protein n=1 Tax=Burkholderia sp. Bp9142 TaxID=2184573 RepID=UPI000F5AA771|nr:methyl-accepting chemotaxis protein [Burkholderia sp. Bp9142]RQR27571.1 HAMP domain-containing protein [Burkholderia sp. Bp9142]